MSQTALAMTENPAHEKRSMVRKPLVMAVSAALALGMAQTAHADFPATFQLSDLDGTNGFKLDGEAEDDNSGVSVSAAGDINGDGVDDLIVGAYLADPNGGNSGRSYVVFGSTAGFASTIQLSALDGSNGFMLDGEAASDYSGVSVSAAGDVNGDGMDDLIVGARRTESGGGFAGRSYVVFGKTGGFTSPLSLSTLDGSDGFMLDDLAEVGAYSARSVSAAGDINGDGVDDLIIGARRANPNGTDSGRSFVVFGKTDGFTSPLSLAALDGSDGFKLDGEATNNRAGHSVSAAGDVNGDGVDDLTIGAPYASNFFGRGYVMFGYSGVFTSPLQLSSLDGGNGFRLDGEAGGHSGYSVSAAGDVNGDGVDDLIVGAPGFDSTGLDSGRSYVVFGQTGAFTSPLQLSALDGTDGFKLDGEVSGLGAESGHSVSAAGDINGDGLDDLIIGAPHTYSKSGDNSGRSYVVFGQTGAFTSPIQLSTLDGSTGFKLDGEAVYDQSGQSVSGAGDINGDGVDDLVIGAHRARPNDNNNSGRSYVVFGGMTGPGEVPVIALTPSELDFGDIEIGIPSSAQSVTLDHTGTGDLVLGSLVLEGVAQADYALTLDTCSGQTLMPDDSCDVELVFTAPVAGVHRARLRIPSNALGNPHLVELIGTSDVVFFDNFEN